MVKDTFIGIGVFGGVLENDFFASVGVAVDAKVMAGVVHADVFAGHAATGFALTFVF